MRAVIGVLGLLTLAAPASAEVVQSSPAGFEITQTVTVDAMVFRTWETLTKPALWWDKDHTYSDDSANLSLDARAPGCFCEKVPPLGSVEHAHVVYVQPPRMIRMVGSLGPLQAEAVTGTLTIRLDPEKDSPRTTRVTFSYIVGGFVRGGADAIAPKVDDVLAEQLLGLKSAAEKPEAPKANSAEGR